VENPAAGNYELYPMAATGGPAAVADQQNITGDFSTGPIGRDTTVYVVFRIGDCVSTPAPVKIQVLLTLELIVPNAFTPNGDGANDVFRIRNPGLVRTFAMTIFNRWGQKVFETTDPYKGWDGTLGGRLQNSGNYVWNIHYTDIVGNSADKGGVVLLIR
jgi:gliding motility-associated-like protein